AEPVVQEVIREETAPTVAETPKVNSNLVHVRGKVYDGRNLAGVENADVSVRRYKNDSLVVRTKTVNGDYDVLLAPYESYRISVDAAGFQSKTVAVKTSGRSEEVKSLFSLSPENYDRPIASIPFTQSLEN